MPWYYSEKKILSVEKLNITWNKQTNFNKLGPLPRDFQTVGGWEICLGGIFLLGGGNLTRSDFGHSNLFQS